MSQRTEKVESIIQQTVAAELRAQIHDSAGQVTVTGVDVSPDLKQAVVWVGLIGSTELFAEVQDLRKEVQAVVAKTLTTKFVPRIEFKLDTGGQYAEHIDRLLKNL
jgi:ribosome-binding factor A